MRRAQAIMLVVATLAAFGCRVGEGKVAAPGTIVLSNGRQLLRCIPAEGSCAPLIPDGETLPKHDLQLWPSYRASSRSVIFEAQAINGPDALVEVDLDGALLEVHPPAHLPAVSPDGSRVAFYARGDLAVRDVEGHEAERVVASGMEKAMPAIWLSAETLLFQGIDRVNRRLDLESGAVTEWDGGEGAPASLSADGSLVVMLESDRLREVTREGADLGRERSWKLSSSARAAIVSPDGRFVAYAVSRPMSLSEVRDVVVLDWDSGNEVRLLQKATLFGGLWVEP